MKKYFVLAGVLIISNWMLAQSDSVSLTTIPAFFHAGDTLADFNKLNGGITNFQVAKTMEQVALENGLAVSNPGVVTITKPELLTKYVLLEVKTFGANKEWYVNTLEVKFDGSVPTVYVQADKIEMATGWRSDGKIFVVITVVGILFAVVLLYLFLLDRKTNELKKKLNS